MARRFQITIYQSNMSTSVGTIADDALMSGRVTWQLNAEDRFIFRVLRSHADYAKLAINRIASLRDTVDSLTRNYTIVSLIDIADGEIYGAEATCEHVHYKLGRSVHAQQFEFIDQTPAVQIAQIVAGYGWTVGTVTPTDKVSIPFNHNFILYDLLQVKDKFPDYDLIFTSVVGGSPSKTVELRVLGSASPVATLKYGVNILNLRREYVLPDANVIYVLGGQGSDGKSMTIGRATHRITAISGSTITFDSRKIVSSNDEWSTGSYALERLNGTTTTITDAIKQVSGFDQVVVSNASGFAVDDAVRIVTSDIPQRDVEIVWDKASVDANGAIQGVFRDENYSDVLNLLGPALKSSLSDTYTSGLCAGWTKVGTCTVAENTDIAYIKNGAKSQHVTVGAFTFTPTAPTVTALATKGSLKGVYLYKIAAVTTDGEGALSVASSSVNVTDKSVKVEKSQTFTDTHIKAWRIYRTKAGGATYYRIADVDAATAEFIDAKNDEILDIEPDATSTAAGGQGITRTFTAVVGEAYSAVIYIYGVSGKVRAQLRFGDYIFPDATFQQRYAMDENHDPVEGFGKIILEGSIIATETTGYLDVLAHEGTAEFYLDAAMVVKSPAAPDAERFVGDNAATELWYRGYDDLQKRKDATYKFTFNIRDLYFTTLGGNSRFDLGDYVTLIDSRFGINSNVRVVSKSFDLLQPDDCDIDVGEVPARLSNILIQRLERDKIATRAMTRQFSLKTEKLQVALNASRTPVVSSNRLSAQFAAAPTRGFFTREFTFYTPFPATLDAMPQKFILHIAKARLAVKEITYVFVRSAAVAGDTVGATCSLGVYGAVAKLATWNTPVTASEGDDFEITVNRNNNIVEAGQTIILTVTNPKSKAGAIFVQIAAHELNVQAV